MSLTFPVGFKIHMKPSLFHASVTWEKPVQMVTVTATVIWQGQNAKGCWAYDLVVQFSYKSFFRFSFHQVYSLSASSSSTPEVFFSAVFMCWTEFSEVAASEFSQRGLALVYDFMYDFHGLMGLSCKRLCVCSTSEAFSVFPVGLQCFPTLPQENKVNIKKKKTFLLKDTSFQVKSLSKRLSWWAHIHARHCVALLRLKI